MSQLNIKVYDDSSTFVVRIEGTLVMDTVTQLNQETRSLFDQAKQTSTIYGVIVDLKKVEVIDSSGIGWICGKFIALKKLGKKLCLCGVNRQIGQFFQMSGLADKLWFYDDIASAKEDLRPVEIRKISVEEEEDRDSEPIRAGQSLSGLIRNRRA